jgi:hypothetical protein
MLRKKVWGLLPGRGRGMVTPACMYISEVESCVKECKYLFLEQKLPSIHVTTSDVTYGVGDVFNVLPRVQKTFVYDILIFYK